MYAHFCPSEPIEDNPDLETYNVQARLDQFVQKVWEQSNMTRGNHVMWTMGSDFNYEDAQPWYLNLDKLIKVSFCFPKQHAFAALAFGPLLNWSLLFQAAKADGRVNAFYSSPAAVRQSAPPLDLLHPLLCY